LRAAKLALSLGEEDAARHTTTANKIVESVEAQEQGSLRVLPLHRVVQRERSGARCVGLGRHRSVFLSVVNVGLGFLYSTDKLKAVKKKKKKIEDLSFITETSRTHHVKRPNARLLLITKTSTVYPQGGRQMLIQRSFLSIGHHIQCGHTPFNSL
jgi:hypothetical protein